MVQLGFLEGKSAGSVRVIQRFPCLIGRAATSDLRLEEIGVWDKHSELRLDHSQGFLLTALSGAFVCVNGQRIEKSVLKNGDIIEIGQAKIRFWLNPTRQRNLRIREALTWAALALLCAAQIAVIYWLPR